MPFPRGFMIRVLHDLGKESSLCENRLFFLLWELAKGRGFMCINGDKKVLAPSSGVDCADGSKAFSLLAERTAEIKCELCTNKSSSRNPSERVLILSVTS